jgi:hypothetical protein
MRLNTFLVRISHLPLPSKLWRDGAVLVMNLLIGLYLYFIYALDVAMKVMPADIRPYATCDGLMMGFGLYLIVVPALNIVLSLGILITSQLSCMKQLHGLQINMIISLVRLGLIASTAISVIIGILTTIRCLHFKCLLFPASISSILEKPKDLPWFVSLPSVWRRQRNTIGGDHSPFGPWPTASFGIPAAHPAMPLPGNRPGDVKEDRAFATDRQPDR